MREPSRRSVAFALAALVLLGALVRLGAASESDAVFHGHADARTYFDAAYGVFLAGHFYPLAHGGSGWPLLMAALYRAVGVGPGPTVPDGAVAPYDATQAEAIALAYAMTALVGAGVVTATALFALRLAGARVALLATALVAFDPFLVGQSGSVLTEGAFATALLLALACAARADRHPAWLLGAGALMAAAHMLRVNGLVMLLPVLAWGALRVQGGWRRGAAWAAAGALAFFLVAAPYLAWRAEHLPGPFDYGTNQRFWADDLWNPSDAYWKGYQYATGGARETAADYFATHTTGQAATRLWESVAWQAEDAFLVVLTPLVAVGALAAAWTHRRHPALLALGFCALATFLTFVWIYPVVRSPRYFAPLLPLAAVAAALAWERLLQASRAAAGVALAVWFAWHVAPEMASIPRAIAFLAAHPGARLLAAMIVPLWLILALLPFARREEEAPEMELAAV